MGLRPWKKDFESSVRPELAVLYRVARRLAGSPDDAEELVQQGLVKAFQGWSSFDGKHLRSWLIRILRNEHYARFRSDKPTVQIGAVDCEEPISDGIWDLLLTREQAFRIVAELENLPTEYRLAVHLCDVEEFSYEEAAQAMDVPLGTVRSRLFRGRQLLRSRLLEYVPVGEGGLA